MLSKDVMEEERKTLVEKRKKSKKHYVIVPSRIDRFHPPRTRLSV